MPYELPSVSIAAACRMCLYIHEDSSFEIDFLFELRVRSVVVRVVLCTTV